MREGVDMIGYKDKDGFHIVLEKNEGQDLIVLVSEGVKAIRAWATESIGEKLKAECVEAAEMFNDKLGIIFVADNYRKDGATKENPVVARIKHPL